MAKVELSPGFFVGDGYPVYIIGEGGNNHQGELRYAKDIVDQVRIAGAECVKFQKRSNKDLMTKALRESKYESPHAFGATYGAHRDALELSEYDFIELAQYCNTKKIAFTASGWDKPSIDFLDKIGVHFFKMASADLTNHDLMEHTAKKGKPMIISTGMASLEEIKGTVALLEKYKTPLVILHCVSTYPANNEELNLNCIITLKKEFPNHVIGYSGHENGIAASVVAVTLGARVVERHFTLNHQWKGSDHAASLEFDGFRRLVRDLRLVDTWKGSFEKIVHPREIPIKKKLGKSVVSRMKIKKGTVITTDHLVFKSPGDGIIPSQVHTIVGKVAQQDIPEDVSVHPSHLHENT
jgi:sialic acid synthase